MRDPVGTALRQLGELRASVLAADSRKGHIAGLGHSPDARSHMHEDVGHHPACGLSDDQRLLREADLYESARECRQETGDCAVPLGGPMGSSAVV